jgi:hypothetical protein
MNDPWQFLRWSLAGVALVYPLWPLLVLASVKLRGRAYNDMLAAWCVAGASGVASLFSPISFPLRLIPEPWNTGLFFATGALLLGVNFGGSYLARRRTRRIGEGAHVVQDLLDITPAEFESLVVELYTLLGHKASRTGAVGDHGVDVIVHANNGEKWVIQCKRWRGTVGEPIVRDFYGVLHHEKADRGAIVTTGKFTEQAMRWARGKPIELVEGGEFLRLMKRARANVSTAR